MAETVVLELTRLERMRLWESLDRMLAGQPAEADALAALRWVRDRIARQCYAEVEGLDLSGDRTVALKALKAAR